MWLTIAKHPRGDWLSIEQVSSGKTELVCPYCSSPLIAKKGKVKSHHFAHQLETCKESTKAAEGILLPFFDTFDITRFFNADERKYLERRRKYTHKNIFWFRGRDTAVTSLERLGVLTSERDNSPEVADVLSRLAAIDPKLNFDDYQLSHELAALCEAFEPMLDLKRAFEEESQISSTKLDALYLKHSRLRLSPNTSLRELNEAQCYWIDLRHKYISLTSPEWLELFEHKFLSLNEQSLYLFEFESKGKPLFLKVGMTSRTVHQRLTEVTGALQSFYPDIKGKVVKVLPHFGRLERSIHRMFESSKVELGTFRELFDVEIKTNFISKLNKLDGDEPHLLPALNVDHPNLVAPSQSADRKGGRKAKTNEELIKEYPDIITALKQGLSIRATSQRTRRAVNTIQRVKKALNSDNLCED
ncbi:competence protein CoiA family protein [Vibrio agarivorans]|nr:competence protein CoiA family protein [Vibrio agarivorans]MDN3661136.1 competence protein CoiA family protein [Vibrio agarivorans]